MAAAFFVAMAVWLWVKVPQLPHVHIREVMARYPVPFFFLTCTLVAGSYWAIALGLACLSYALQRFAPRPEPAKLRQRREQSDFCQGVLALSLALNSGLDIVAALSESRTQAKNSYSEVIEQSMTHVTRGATVGQALATTVPSTLHWLTFSQVIARSERSGSSLVLAMDSLSEGLQRERAAEQLARVKRVPIVAALPLGLCFLPAFVLLAVVPVVGLLLHQLR